MTQVITDEKFNIKRQDISIIHWHFDTDCVIINQYNFKGIGSIYFYYWNQDGKGYDSKIAIFRIKWKNK
jgi:hypothetical protein